MFLMFSNVNSFLWHFLTKSKHPMTLKIKDKKKLFGRNCILGNFITRKFELQGVFLWIKNPNPVFSRIRNTCLDRMIQLGVGTAITLLSPLFRPHDTVGCWYSNNFVISSEHDWLTHGISSNKLWINKVQTRGSGR